MSCHTSFKIGGAADIFISVGSPSELSAVFKKCVELDIPRLVIGKGSNLLVSDSGVEGAVISLLNMNGISVKGEEIICGAGAALSDVCRAALDNSLTGLEFAYGIPGSIGGAVYMNAGAYSKISRELFSTAGAPPARRLKNLGNLSAIGYSRRRA